MVRMPGMNLFDALRPWTEVVLEQVPGLELFDAHTHLGHNDPDGMKQSGEELTAALRLADARGAFVFPFHEPDGYRAANDVVIEAAREADGLLVPFCRVDPHDDPLPEAKRSLENGARGIKLHPRAEQFTLDHPGVRPLIALADERSLPVLIHAGRGIPALGLHAVQLAEDFPNARLILAHAGICDLSWIWRVAGELPNLLFDTAWWIPADLETLFSLVPPGQIVFASRRPLRRTRTSRPRSSCAGPCSSGSHPIRSARSPRVSRCGWPPESHCNRAARPLASASAPRTSCSIGSPSSCCSARSAPCGASIPPRCSPWPASPATCPTTSMMRRCSPRSVPCSTTTRSTRPRTRTRAGGSPS